MLLCWQSFPLASLLALYHHFSPVSTTEMGVKRDTTFEYFFDFKTGQYREVSEIESSTVQAPRQAALNLSGEEYVVSNFQAKHCVETSTTCGHLS